MVTDHLIYRSSAVLWLGLGLCNLSSCAGDSATSAVQRSDSAGIEIVLSTGADRGLDWRFPRLFELGGSDEGPESFFRVAPGLVGADAAGNLYLLDPENARVVVFDADGQFLRSMGESGGGPGEFQAPGSLSVSAGGEVAVFDFGKGSLVRFDENGEAVDEQPFPLFPTPNAQRHFSLAQDTTLVSTSTSPMEPGDLTQFLRQIVGMDTVVLAEFRLPRAEVVTFEECGLSIPMLPVFAPEVPWAAQPGMVAVGYSAEYSISMLEAGSITRILRRDIAAPPASREQAILNRAGGFRLNTGQGLCAIDPADIVDKGGYADALPLIRTVYLSPSGELWVQRFTVERDAVAPIDVFDVRGAYIGTIAEGSISPIILLPGERVGVVEADEFDVQRLVVLSIEK